MAEFIATPRHVEHARRIAARELVIAGGQTGYENLHPIHEDLWHAGLAEVHRPTPLRDTPVRDDYWRLTEAGEEWLAKKSKES